MKKTTLIIVTLTLCILLFSLVVLYSSCHQQGIFVRKGIFYKQILWIAIGLSLMGVMYHVDYRRLKDVAWPIYIVAIVLLVLVMVIGRIRLGAQRWLSLGGFTLQPSEIGKLGLLLVLARYFSQKGLRELRFFQRRQSLQHGFLIPLAVTFLGAGLVALQPDLGTAIMYVVIFFALAFFSGVRARYLFGFLGIVLACSPIFWSFLRGYQKDRLLVFLNPNRDPLGAGYTIIQSKIAIGSGQLLGKGWLGGTQNQLNFLPERHTDFIFSVIGEEWGLVGGVLLIALFYFLIKTLFELAQFVSDPFAKQVCFGVAALILVQLFINVAMTIGFMPVVGLPLPFISYGGSSLVSFMLLIGITLNISRYH